MNALSRSVLLGAICAVAAGIAAAPLHAGSDHKKHYNHQRDEQRKALKGSLELEKMGSFFVGGDVTTSPALTGSAAGFVGYPNTGTVTINQMYVQYMKPTDDKHNLPIILVHGCCLSSKTWETTPDGRVGWDQYFVRRNRDVYLAEQSGRGRSGFNGTLFNQARIGTIPASAQPSIIMASHEVAWGLFRFGPAFNVAFADEQFPTAYAGEMYKQVIPDIGGALPAPNPTFANLAALTKKTGPAVLIGHSQSGFYPQRAALVDPSNVKGMITLEMACVTTLTDAEMTALAKIPQLIMYGDHLEASELPPEIGPRWTNNFNTCQNDYIPRIKAKGGDITMMYLPDMGIYGNSHMLMQDKNSLDLADLVIDWIEKHVERKRRH